VKTVRGYDGGDCCVLHRRMERGRYECVPFWGVGGEKVGTHGAQWRHIVGGRYDMNRCEGRER